MQAVNIYDRAKRHQMLKVCSFGAAGCVVTSHACAVLQELKAYSQVSSRYVVRLVGAYTDQEKGQLVMALEYMNRGRCCVLFGVVCLCQPHPHHHPGSLKHIVNHHGAMSEEVLKVVAQGMAGGLRTLHRKKQVDTVLLGSLCCPSHATCPSAAP